MDLKEQGFDKDVKKYFRKILYSISWGLMLLMAALTAGIYYKLGFIEGSPGVYSIIFYVLLLAGIVVYVIYLARTWKNGGR